MDDLICTGQRAAVLKAKAEMMHRFECDEVGELREYVRCKLDWHKRENWLKFTEPVLIQSVLNEFDLASEGNYGTPAEPGQVLQTGDSKEPFSK